MTGPKPQRPPRPIPIRTVPRAAVDALVASGAITAPALEVDR